MYYITVIDITFMVVLFQMELYAFNVQNPSLVATAFAVIYVDHNPGTPRFPLASYTETISEYFPLGVRVIGVNATDPDNVSFYYRFCVSLNKSIKQCIYYPIMTLG